MNDWLAEHLEMEQYAPSRIDPIADKLLRVSDLLIASLGLLILAIPLTLALVSGRLKRLPMKACNGQPFNLLRLEFSNAWHGRLARLSGASRWPVLFNILKGDMAWVGPAPVDSTDAKRPAAPVRPGAIHLLAIRQLTASDFTTQERANAEYLVRRSLRHDLGFLLRWTALAMIPRSAKPISEHIQICDVQIANLTMQQAIEKLQVMLDSSKAHQVSFANPFCINMAAKVRAYRNALANADLVLPDGIGVRLAADILGSPIRQNVNGTDLFPRLCAMLEERGSSLYLLGGQPGVPEFVAACIKERWPNLRIAGLRDGFFNVEQEAEVAEQVRLSGADVVLVARGVPMQDVFIARYIDAFGARIVMGVGGLFDFVSGRIERAPGWMRESGLEWVFRFLQEPGRMWQRYLVGNFSFLARVMGQRFSLRKKAPVIPVPEISLPAEEPEAPRLPDVIIIATSATRRDFPVPEDFPSGLLPIGTATVIEHLITALASTKFREIDMVVSLRPEAFRKVLGDGERWGVHINWVLAKDPDRPYEAIRGRYPRVDTRLLVGHCDLWLATDALEAMQAQEGMSVFLGDGDAIEWTGWANISASELLDIPSHVTRSEFEDFIAKRNPSQLVLYDSQCACLRSPAKLLKAQSLALHQQTQCAAPSTWIRHDWGAICPTAFLSPNARVIAPVLIGPGCMVMAGATVGPNAVLTRDVIVGYGTCVNDSLVLAKTLLGAEMDVSNSIVQGNLVQNLALNVRTAMHQTDGLLLDLKRVDSLFVALLARLVAFMVLVTLSPVVLLLLAIRRLLGSTLPWQHQSIVVGRDLVRKNLKMTSLRCARLSSPILGCFGELIDVGLGRRNWFGIRARSAPEWYALSPEWQQLMSNAPIGLFNQVCWNDGLDQESEFAAAADALFIAREGTQERFKIFMANCKRLFRAQ